MAVWTAYAFCVVMLTIHIDFLKLADDTDMDVLNSCMETMVECYHAELMPVAGQLTARLVSLMSPWWYSRRAY
jgi:hypothetical protein